MAKEKGGVTLESTIEAVSICMPEWNFNNPSTMEAWDLTSGTYAEQIAGEITINPKTWIETIIFEG